MKILWKQNVNYENEWKRFSGFWKKIKMTKKAYLIIFWHYKCNNRYKYINNVIIKINNVKQVLLCVFIACYLDQIKKDIQIIISNIYKKGPKNHVFGLFFY